MNITISGASGLIGRRLLKNLVNAGHTLHVLSRHAGTNLPPNVKLSVWDPVKGRPPEESLRDADAVIHLAGEPVAQRWTQDSKRRIRESRVTGTRNLVAAMAELSRRPQVLVSASAVGYYGSRGADVLDETASPASDFLGELCADWEKEARAAESLGVRVVTIRTGIVLDARGGALQRMLPAFRMGAGGKLADGRHWMSWIHLEDLAAMYRFAAETPAARGPFNGVAPNPVTNADFTRTLAGVLHRPAIFPVPAFALKLMFGEMSQILLASQRVLPKVPEAAGFQFRFSQLQPALADALRSN
ncbi:MAG TPA: TIGR01777 family oxidoreductase [Bryobacteraceae bacterium]|nr:TIGR01777 family oxidoreductase [Anaerolineales bacterium]HTR36978.1 TIGR01777 family oxidoreductase [Bryobacteraceae bacterium]